MATTGLSYRIWVETQHDFSPSTHNRARLRRVALGLIETGFIYLTIQLSYTVTTAVIWYQYTHGNHTPTMGVTWAWNVTNPLNAMIPVSDLARFVLLAATDLLMKLVYQGIALTLIAAKINISSIIGSQRDLINEVFAPWRSKSSHHISGHDSQDTTHSGFTISIIMSSQIGSTQSSQGASTHGLKAKDLEGENKARGPQFKHSPC